PTDHLQLHKMLIYVLYFIVFIALIFPRLRGYPNTRESATLTVSSPSRALIWIPATNFTRLKVALTDSS
ncbi:MAG: hypothetical protein VW202_12475, partial [Halieaceae bacterium]